MEKRVEIVRFKISYGRKDITILRTYEVRKWLV